MRPRLLDLFCRAGGRQWDIIGLGADRDAAFPSFVVRRGLALVAAGTAAGIAGAFGPRACCRASCSASPRRHCLCRGNPMVVLRRDRHSMLRYSFRGAHRSQALCRRELRPASVRGRSTARRCPPYHVTRWPPPELTCRRINKSCGAAATIQQIACQVQRSLGRAARRFRF